MEKAQNNELKIYLLEQCGGKEAAVQQFYKEKLKRLIHQGHTVGEILIISKAEQWDSHIEGMMVADVLGLKKPYKRPVITSAPINVVTHRKKLTPAAKMAIRSQIKVFLKEKGWSTCYDIIRSIHNRHPNEIKWELAGMIEDGLVNKTGECDAMVYALHNEIEQPPNLNPYPYERTIDKDSSSVESR